MHREVECAVGGCVHRGFCWDVLWEHGSALCLLDQEQWARCSCPGDALGNSYRSVQDGCPVVQSAVRFIRRHALKAEKGERGKGQEENRGHLKEREHILEPQGIEDLLLGVTVIIKVVRRAKEVNQEATCVCYTSLSGGTCTECIPFWRWKEVLEMELMEMRFWSKASICPWAYVTAGKEILKNMLC